MSSARPPQSEKAQALRALHAQAGGFIVPNPWDAGSARLLAQAGFKALATTSAGFAYTQGARDGGVPRDRVLAHLAALVDAVDLPISADLENGFGAAPEVVGQTITLAAQAGVVGGSIEDSTGRPESPLFPVAQAAERIRAAVAAARALPFAFTLTARAENFVVDRPDLADTIARLQAYQAAGADVLFAPGLKRRADIATVLREVDRPLNVVVGSPGMEVDARELLDMGVQRVSVGASLARLAFSALLRAARELAEQGTSTYGESALGGRALDALFPQ